MHYNVKVTWDDTVSGYDELPTEWVHVSGTDTSGVIEAVQEEIAANYPDNPYVGLSITLAN